MTRRLDWGQRAIPLGHGAAPDRRMSTPKAQITRSGAQRRRENSRGGQSAPYSQNAGQVDVRRQEQQDSGQADAEDDVEQAASRRQPGAVGRWIRTMASTRIPAAPTGRRCGGAPARRWLGQPPGRGQRGQHRWCGRAPCARPAGDAGHESRAGAYRRVECGSMTFLGLARPPGARREEPGTRRRRRPSGRSVGEVAGAGEVHGDAGAGRRR